MKKQTKKSVIKKLQNKAEKLWKEYCHKRDGKGCQVQKHYPHLNLIHSKILQVDHCFSRNKKALFLEVANGTIVCSSCNAQKGWGNRVIARAIEDIVINREGQDVFDRMSEVSLQTGFLQWKNINWLELQIEILTDMGG